MKRNNFIILYAITTIALLSTLIIKYGRQIYKPLVNKMKNAETVESVKSKLAEDVIYRLGPYLHEIGMEKLPDEIAMIGLKEEQKLEVYAKTVRGYKRLITYPFTGMSGTIGPKLKEGDRQIPEGIYQIEYLNPNSSYYLSIKVNYPNEYDKRMALLDQRTDLGGDIFIHGKSNTVGCIPIGDEKIEELFILAENAINQGIPVIISPHDFRVTPKTPTLRNIAWSEELYSDIKSALKAFPSEELD